jgi:hypothetical protein
MMRNERANLANLNAAVLASPGRGLPLGVGGGGGLGVGGMGMGMGGGGLRRVRSFSSVPMMGGGMGGMSPGRGGFMRSPSPGGIVHMPSPRVVPVPVQPIVHNHASPCLLRSSVPPSRSVRLILASAEHLQHLACEPAYRYDGPLPSSGLPFAPRFTDDGRAGCDGRPQLRRCSSLAHRRPVGVWHRIIRWRRGDVPRSPRRRNGHGSLAPNGRNDGRHVSEHGGRHGLPSARGRVCLYRSAVPGRAYSWFVLLYRYSRNPLYSLPVSLPQSKTSASAKVTRCRAE